ncbi:hypothetical protein GCM10023194_27850 [Planotetraspora phitsanulokensis]|uniref:Lipoprotein n=1 Tax=Planotetraspora phitsanulokensis TaxID=575192 RepID=A0A8J3XH15_9ACTN|nr:hypothetical protein [Planotetraspora phitsanulokensis]GII36078.1 hypothetical protein Pph01_10810 [Planotetraspora phitsanulokensis]
MKTRRAGLLLLAPVLAACAATSTPGATPAPSPSASAVLAVYRELATCLRQHGVPNFPDPVMDAQGNVQVNPSVRIPASAKTACASIAARLPGENKGPTYSAADMAKLRQLARCFRDHGIPDWPDPNARGEFPMPKRLLDLGKRGWREQLPACRQYFVGKSIVIVSASENG